VRTHRGADLPSRSRHFFTVLRLVAGSRRDIDVRARAIELHGRTVFVLNGLCSLDDDAIERLLEAVKKDPDAVAFGCMNGKWVAAA
jgi:hypothetical protein